MRKGRSSIRSLRSNETRLDEVVCTQDDKKRSAQKFVVVPNAREARERNLLLCFPANGRLRAIGRRVTPSDPHAPHCRSSVPEIFHQGAETSPPNP
jgi:hypothetical protein